MPDLDLNFKPNRWYTLIFIACLLVLGWIGANWKWSTSSMETLLDSLVFAPLTVLFTYGLAWYAAGNEKLNISDGQLTFRRTLGGWRFGRTLRLPITGIENWFLMEIKGGRSGRRTLLIAEHKGRRHELFHGLSEAQMATLLSGPLGSRLAWLPGGQKVLQVAEK